MVTYHNTFFIPIFLGLLATGKAFVKTVTPKIILLVAKNSVFLKVRQLMLRGSTEFLILSHRPWRQKLRSFNAALSALPVRIIARYMRYPLWIRTAIALLVLALTASSSYVFIALLIIPQPLLLWIRNLILNTLNKLGITKLFATLWRYLIPPKLQYRAYLYRKWTLGRRQIRTARTMHQQISNVPMGIFNNIKPTDNRPEKENNTDQLK